MVVICTIKFNIKKFCVLPTECIYVFCISEQAANFVPWGINRLLIKVRFTALYDMGI
jgi:hypothetical protein